jgi:hypothetical protein
MDVRVAAYERASEARSEPWVETVALRGARDAASD